MVVSVTGPRIEFRALGSAELRSPEAELRSILARPKLLGLLSFLAVDPAYGFHRRDRLLGLFWAETDQPRARSALRQSLYYLRQSLGPGVLTGRGEEEVGLDDTQIWCDVAAFEGALGEGRTEEALELYRGDLLEGFFVSNAPEFERWLGERRDELRRRASEGAWLLAERAATERNAAAAGRWAHRATSLEPFDESLATAAIELLDRMGDRAGALRLFETFAGRLEEGLDLEPTPETRQLVEEIRARVEPTGAFRQDRPREPTPAAGSADPPVEAADPPVEAGRRSSWWIRGASAGALVAAALLLVFLTRPSRAPLEPGRVVVAIFDNETGDPELDPLGRMVADWITQEIDGLGLVDVVPSPIGLFPRADFAEPGPVSAVGLAEETGARTVIDGAYYLRGDSVVVHAQIIDAGNGDLLGAVSPVTGPVDGLGLVVDSLTRRVLRTLAVAVDPTLARSGDRSRPPSLEAYRQYLEGYRTFQHVPTQMREALTYFYRAVERDSTFIAPRFYLVMAHANLDEFAAADSNARLLDGMRPRLSEPERHMLDWLLARLRGDLPGALEAARARGGPEVGREALRVNRPAEAIEALTAVDLTPNFFLWLSLMEAFHISGDYESELREARRAREALPGRLGLVEAESRALAALGRTDEARRATAEGYSLPLEPEISPATVAVAVAAELRAHGYAEAAGSVAERAIEWLRARPEPESDTAAHRLTLARAYLAAERWQDAAALLRALARENPTDPFVLGDLGTSAARLGHRDEALAISDSLGGLARPPNFGADLFRQARIAAVLGDREEALSLLRAAVAAGWSFSVYVHADPDLEPLRGYAPFEEFMQPKG